MMRINEKEASRILKAYDEYIIVTHASPDGDTLGCGYALLRALKNSGKRAKIVNSDTIPVKFDFLCEQSLEVNDETAAVIAVDVADKRLMGELEEAYGKRVLLCIDHHPSNTGYSEKLLLDPEAAAASEIVYRVIKAMGEEIDSRIATALYTGISTDTGCFRYSNVTAYTHACAGELIALGADHVKSDTLMFETKSIAAFNLEKAALEGLKILYGGKAAMIVLTKDMFLKSGADESCADAIKAIPRQIEGVKVGITVREKEKGGFKISVRTHEPYDAAAICCEMGGGGHVRAAGCETDLDLEETEKKLLSVIDRYLLN